MTDSAILKLLQQVEALNDVPENQLEWLVSKSNVKNLEDGELLFKKGSSIENLYVILKGKFIVKVEQGGNFRTIGEFEEKTITGWLPYSRAKEAIGYAYACGDTSVLAFHKENFQQLITENFELTRSLVHFMTSRVRQFTKQQQQNDKMAALGKLSAGLAHELNNPSAAVVRSAQSLNKHLSNLPEKFKAIISIKMGEDQIDHINNILFKHLRDHPGTKMSLMERSEKEDDMLDWLEGNNMSDCEDLAENLVDFGFDIEDLEEMENEIPREHRAAVLNWVNQVLTTEKMVGEIEEAARRINELVTSIKSYTHMDQSPEKKKVNIHNGLDSTINMLKHKISKNNITITKNYDDNLPEIPVFVSELNQVWTNLIDNAIDAMEESATKKLIIKTSYDSNYVKVNIADTGSGIPEEHLDKIFDPFFTTKEIGQGTGLGLDVVLQIINQHNARINVNSKKGSTVFEISLPL